MKFQPYYVLRSKSNGAYLTARAQTTSEGTVTYLLLFQQDHEALSYVNTHAPDLCDRFSIETLMSSQIKPLLQRWGYQGIGLVNDSLQPRIAFMLATQLDL